MLKNVKSHVVKSVFLLKNTLLCMHLLISWVKSCFQLFSIPSTRLQVKFPMQCMFNIPYLGTYLLQKITYKATGQVREKNVISIRIHRHKPKHVHLNKGQTSLIFRQSKRCASYYTNEDLIPIIASLCNCIVYRKTNNYT